VKKGDGEGLLVFFAPQVTHEPLSYLQNIFFKKQIQQQQLQEQNQRTDGKCWRRFRLLSCG
jgi:hypothetical protein